MLKDTGRYRFSEQPSGHDPESRNPNPKHLKASRSLMFPNPVTPYYRGLNSYLYYFGGSLL